MICASRQCDSGAPGWGRIAEARAPVSIDVDQSCVPEEPNQIGQETHLIKLKVDGLEEERSGQSVFDVGSALKEGLDFVADFTFDLVGLRELDVLVLRVRGED